MYIVTASEMRAIDSYAIDRLGIPAMVLMENAGRAIAEEAARLADERGHSSGRSSAGAGRGRAERFRWLILVGKGNNGGDGLVCTRHLTEMGYAAEIGYAVPPEQLTGEAAQQRDIAERMGLPAFSWFDGASEAGDNFRIDGNRWDGIVDALLGTGTSGPPRERYAALIRAANESGLPIVAADIPSGLNADTGGIPGECIHAAITVALAYRKRGLMLYPGAEAAGKVVVRQIGIPAASAEAFGVKTFVLDEDTLQKRFGLVVPPDRRSDSHKGTYGHALVAAGSAAMSGAGMLCARAALRAGSGLVSWAVPGRLIGRLTGLFPEAMLRAVADNGSGEWRDTSAGELIEASAGKQAVVVGPGLGRWPGDGGWLRELWSGIEAPLVIDADGLNMLADASNAGGRDDAGEHADGAVGGTAGGAVGDGEKAGGAAGNPVGETVGGAAGNPVGNSAEGALGEDTGNPVVVTVGGFSGGADADTAIKVSEFAGGTAERTIEAGAGGHAASWPRRRTPAVLTPHPGEMARLCGLTVAEVQRDRIGAALDYARKREVVVVLKGAHTVIAAPDGQVYVNTTGNPGMSTGGAGDVLAGIIGALLAQRLEPLQAAVAGVYWHGLAGDRAAAARSTQASLIAGDIIETL